MSEALNILVVFHTPSNEGYAMSPLEKTFYEVAVSITTRPENVHFAFSNLNAGNPRSLPTEFLNIFEINAQRLQTKEYFLNKKAAISALQIDLALCFDLPVKAPLVKLLRDSGVKRVASYWGASMSSINSGLKLLLKKLEVSMAKNRPDLFIFESEAMRRQATDGRGLRKAETTVIPTGVDVAKFIPNGKMRTYTRKEFDIPQSRKIAIYSGHMEERKGVWALMKSMVELVDRYENESWHLLVCGNRPGEEKQFEEMIATSKARKFITFAGYRNDLHQIMPGCDLGVIASTGWDSFPMSALEMAACGLPLVVSRLQGLVETVVENETALLFEPGDSSELAAILHELSDDDASLAKMAESGRMRIEQSFSISHQKDNLRNALLGLIEGC